MPMMAIWLRFPRAAVPSEETVRRGLTAAMGPRLARRIDELTIDGTTMVVCSMSPIVIIYTWKVAEELGGVRTHKSSQAFPPTLPDWAQQPWTSYGLVQRARIRLGRIRF